MRHPASFVCAGIVLAVVQAAPSWGHAPAANVERSTDAVHWRVLGSGALDPEILAALLRSSPRVVVEAAGCLELTGDWKLGAGTLEIHAAGALVTRDLSLDAPSLRLTLEGGSVRIAEGSTLAVAGRGGDGGEITLRARGDAGDVTVLADATLDATGAEGRGGRIHLDGAAVHSAGALLARGRGRIEVDARNAMTFTGPADTAGGTIRLDPRNMVIGSFAGVNTNVASSTMATTEVRSPSADTGQLDAGNLVALLGTNDVIVHTLSTGGAAGITLPAGFTVMDATGGDIEVQADVVWSSGHALWLLAHDDLIVRANVQGSGAGGSVVGIAGWDGTTFSGLDTDPLDPATSTVYGAGSGDVFVLGRAGNGAGVAFGSRTAATVLAGNNVRVLGSTDPSTVTANGSNTFALVGYRVVGAVDTSGAIHVAAKNAVQVTAGLDPGTMRSAQIGHGGCLNAGFGTTQGNLAGDIAVAAGGGIEVKSGTRQSYGMIGHGGCANNGSTRGNLSGSIDVRGASILMQIPSAGVTSQQNFAMIGHGGQHVFGSSSTGAISGSIHVETTNGDLQLLQVPPTAMTGTGICQIGHGGEINTDAGGIARTSIASVTGNISVSVANDLVLEGGGIQQSTSQIGHGGYILSAGAYGPATGDIDVTVGRDATIRSTSTILGNPRPAQIGHGGGSRAIFVPSGAADRPGEDTVRDSIHREALSGAIRLTAGRDLRLVAGDKQTEYVQIGHGGMLWTEQANTISWVASSSGDVTVQASSIEMRGGAGADPNTSAGAYAQIGNGGGLILLHPTSKAKHGLESGNVHVTATGITCGTLPCGNLHVIGGPTATNGNYAWIGHGGEAYDTGVGSLGTTVGVAGDVTVTVAKETSLVNGPTDFWHLGHLQVVMTPPAPLLPPTISGNVTLDTGALDFDAAATGGDATIDDARFFPQFVWEAPSSPAVDYLDNTQGGDVTLRVHGASGNDGLLDVREPLAVPAAATHPVRLRSTDDLVLGDAITHDGAALVDLVADDANPSSPNQSATANLTIAAGGSIGGAGATRLFAVAPAQFTAGSYLPANTAYGIWYGDAGAVVGVNFKSLPPSADLSVTKSDTPDPATAGANLVYTMQVNNAGPGPAAAVSLQDTLPAGTTFVSLPTPAGWSCGGLAVGGGGTLTCTSASVPVGNSSFTLTVKVDPNVAASTVLSNTATVSSSTPDPNSGNESATATTTVATSADVSMTQADAPDPVTAGTDLTYTLTFGNAGPSDAAAPAWSDTLPAGTTFVSLSSPGGWSCTTPSVGASGTVSCSASALSSTTAGFTLVVHVSPSVASGTVLSNTATASATTSDPNPGNESATATTTVATSADLVLAKTDAPDPANAGEQITYSLTLTNAGPSDAAAAALDDPLPAGTAFVSLSSPADWSCTTPAVGANGTVHCTHAAFAPGSASFTLVVAIAAATADGTLLTNTATATASTSDPSSANDSATATTTVGTAADLSLTETDGPDPVSPGTDLTYTITLTNAGPSNAAAPALDDALPVGTSFVSLGSPAGWSCTTPAVGANGTVHCTKTSLAPGSDVFTLVVQIGGAVAPATVLDNTATVTSTTNDPNPGQESATASTTVGGGGFLTVTPCRALDTRAPSGPSGGPALVGDAARDFPLVGLCGVPATAKAVAVNLTVVGAATSGTLKLYASDLSTPPTAWVLPFNAGVTRASNAIVMPGADGQVRVFLVGGGSAHVILDVSGYFE